MKKVVYLKEGGAIRKMQNMKTFLPAKRLREVARAMETKVIFDGLEKIDRLEIAKFLIKSGSGIKVVDNPLDIGKIIKLLQQPFEKCEVFIDSPRLRSFRIELFQQGKMVLRIPVAGNFVEKNDDWYLMTNPVLLGELTRQTRNIPLKKMQATFA